MATRIFLIIPFGPLLPLLALQWTICPLRADDQVSRRLLLALLMASQRE
jgi:hypothetical protein